MVKKIDSEFIHIVIGIVKNTKGEVLVACRKPNTHLGGLLEFPGGKVKENETFINALNRELHEELNIDVRECSNLIQFPYSYPDRRVYLDVYTIDKYFGNIKANEFQHIEWRKLSSLSNNEFPSANHGIIQALQLPKVIAVTPNYGQDKDDFLYRFKKTIRNENISIIHLRSHNLNDHEYIRLAEECFKLCNESNKQLVLNRDIRSVNQIRGAGLHLTAKRLLSINERPFGEEFLVSASCHTHNEVRHACDINLDYIFLGPVLEKHLIKDSQLLGWDTFAEITRESTIPVYAIGGVCELDVESSRKFGGQGIAAIRDLWQ